MRFFLVLFLPLILLSAPAYADQIQDAKSKIELGVTLEFGTDGHKNPAVARQMYDTALKILQPLAEKGNADAQFELGMMYLHGQAGPQVKTDGIWWNQPDYVDALKWWSKAADQDNRKAQKQVSWMYLTGFAGKKDLEEAYFWKSLAMRPLDAGELVLEISFDGADQQYLTPEQKAAVKKRVAEWKPIPAPSKEEPK